MQRTIKYILLTISTVFLASCGNNVSLQRYYVDNQESKNFISQDIPLSMLKLDKTDFTEDQKKAYNSVNKLNFLGYKTNETNLETYKTELAKVKTILNNNKYKDLMEFSDKGNKVVVKYVGDDNQADEVVVLGSTKELGFGIVRILGDDMSPNKIAILINAMQNANIDENQIEGIINFFK